MKEDTGRSITLNGYEILQAEVSSHHQAGAVCSEINRCVKPSPEFRKNIHLAIIFSHFKNTGSIDRNAVRNLAFNDNL